MTGRTSRCLMPRVYLRKSFRLMLLPALPIHSSQPLMKSPQPLMKLLLLTFPMGNLMSPLLMPHLLSLLSLLPRPPVLMLVLLILMTPLRMLLLPHLLRMSSLIFLSLPRMRPLLLMSPSRVITLATLLQLKKLLTQPPLMT